MTIHRFGLISDTHGHLHRDVPALFERVEAVLHAGDVGGESVMMELNLLGSVYAVAGNVDYSTPELPMQRIVDLPFGKVVIVHGHRYPDDKHARIRALYDAFSLDQVRIIMHGHTHHQHLEFHGGIFLVNPGAAGKPRFGVPPSVCLLEWDSVRDSLRFDFHPLDWS